MSFETTTTKTKQNNNNKKEKKGTDWSRCVVIIRILLGSFYVWNSERDIVLSRSQDELKFLYIETIKLYCIVDMCKFGKEKEEENDGLIFLPIRFCYISILPWEIVQQHLM